MNNTPSTQTTVESHGAVRVFYAFIIVVIGCMIGWFVWQNATLDNATRPFKLGLDLAGGSHLVYEADVSNIDPVDVPDLMNVLRDVIERRVNAFGVSEPIVQVEQSSFAAEVRSERLVVELPGITDVATAVKEIGKTPLLEFKLIDEEALAAQEALAGIEANNTATSGLSVGNIRINGEEVGEPYIATELTGRYLANAQLEFLGQSNTAGPANEPIVAVTFTDEGAEIFYNITAENVGERLAIFLDGTLVSAPVINEAIGGGRAIISGNFDPEEARDLAQNLSFGALPVPITLASTQTIGASLGGGVLEKGVTAGMIGLSFVIVFMVAWYRVPGVVAAIALLFYVASMLALFQLIPVTLTAAGLAGFVLSLGMAVDANVLVFERMKEEYRGGKGTREAARVGFSRAWSAIRDGNITSLLSAIILFWFGTSIVKGFALVFGIGVIVSMLTALLVTRTLLVALPNMRLNDALGWIFNSGIRK